MFVATRALILLIFLLSQPLAAFEGVCVVQSARDGQTGFKQCFQEQCADKQAVVIKLSRDLSRYDPYESTVSSCSIQHELLGAGRVPEFCEQLA